MDQWVFEQAARAYHAAYLARRAAKAALRAYRVERGMCTDYRSPEGENWGPCYTKHIAIGRWCDVCRNRQPLWEAYQAAATLQGRALRIFLNEGQRP